MTAGIETLKLLKRDGFYRQFETAFVSIAHTDEDIEKTIAAALQAFKNLQTNTKRVNAQEAKGNLHSWTLPFARFF